MTFGEKLKEIRLSRGMTQLQLAQAVGANTKSYISKIELGYRTTTLSMTKKLANALKVSVDELLDGVSPSDPVLEFLPYLSVAEEWQLKAVREILHMP